MVLEVQHSQSRLQFHYANRRIRRGKGKLAEYLDNLLDGRGYYRKQTAKDASCIFRAVSEQLFHSQRFHTLVRMACLRYMERNHDVLTSRIGKGNLSYELERMRSPREWVTTYEIEAMSLLYKRDFVVFEGDKEVTTNLTNNNFPQKIVLCQLGKNHYDSLFMKTYVEHLAMCQSIAYDILYAGVFGVNHLNESVKSMLYSIPSSMSRKYGVECSLVPVKDSATGVRTTDDNFYRGSTPFPYKVAKALDCFTYRNIEFDMWVSELRESRRNAKFRNEVLQIGSKCIVTLPNGDGRQYFAYIQDMLPNGGPVCVFIEGLGVKCVVDLAAVETLTIPVGQYGRTRDGKHRLDTQHQRRALSSSYSNCSSSSQGKSDSAFLKSHHNSTKVKYMDPAAYDDNGSYPPVAETYQTEPSYFNIPDPSASALVPYGNTPVMGNPYVPQEAVAPKVPPVYVVLPPNWPLGAPLPVLLGYVNGQAAPVVIPQNYLYPVYPGPSEQSLQLQDFPLEQQQQLPCAALESQGTNHQSGFIQSYEGQPLFQSKWNDPYFQSQESRLQQEEQFHLMPYTVQHYVQPGDMQPFPSPDGPAIFSGPLLNSAGSTRSHSGIPQTQAAELSGGLENSFARMSLWNSGLHSERLVDSGEIKKLLAKASEQTLLERGTLQDEVGTAVRAFCTYAIQVAHSGASQTDRESVQAYLRTIELNFEKLRHVDVILLLHSLSLSIPRSKELGVDLFNLVKNLDRFCKRKLSIWALNEAFLVGDAWFHMGKTHPTSYVSELVSYYGNRLHQMSKGELVHFLFFVNLTRAFPPTLKPDVLERRLESMVGELLTDEFSVVSMAFFKCKRAIQSEVVTSAILDHLVRNKQDVSEVALSALLKVVRKSVEGKPKYAQRLKNLNEVFRTQISRLNTWNCIHLLLSGSLLNVFDTQNIELVTGRFLDMVPSLRLKDIERLLFVLAVTGHESPASDAAWRMAEQELRQPLRQGELVKYGRSLVSLLVYFATVNKYPLDLFEKVFQKDFVRHVLDSGYSDTRRELLTLHCSLEIEQPQYQGPLLPAGLYEEITKAYTKPLPSWSTRNTFADNFFVDLLCSVQDSLGGSQYARLQYTLPHYASPDIVFYLDQDGRPHPLPSTSLEKTTSTSGLQKCLLVPGARNMYLRSTSKPTGVFRMKLRQLEALGFRVVHMAWFEYMLHTSMARRESVRRKLAPLVSTTG